MTSEIAASVVIIVIFLLYFQKRILVEVKCIINRETNTNLTKLCQMSYVCLYIFIIKGTQVKNMNDL